MPTSAATPAVRTGPAASVDPAAIRAVGPVLVATDGSTGADAAVRMAAELAQQSGAELRVVTVLPPAPLVAADYGMVLPPIETEQARHEQLDQRVRAQLKETLGTARGWTLDVIGGDPATRIAAAAVSCGARMIVLGLGHHDLLDRLFGGETAIHVLRQAGVPVVAVPPQAHALPTRVLVAVDFSAASVRAARAALVLFPGIKVLYLVHVAPRLELQPEAYAMWMTEYGDSVEPAFRKVVAEVGAPSTCTVETMTLTGKPSRALLDFAKSAHVDAVVTGSRGGGFIDRMLVGSTATGLIRGTHTMLLAVPAHVTPIALPDTTRHEDWVAVLTEFTRRNAGRSARLEVDDADIGAQTIHRGYPFLGAAWDHNDQRVEVMMGEQEGTRHFSRGIPNVTSVDVLRDAQGRDVVLRVAHGSGQTILTLVR